MKEIKFRSWDNEFKAMSNPFTIVGYARDYVRGDGIYPNIDVTSANILMQYTCLKDKNEKEIYEGDIVRIWEIGEFINCEVIFKDGCFTMEGRQFVLNVGTYNPRFEIIGNVYEHPGLF